MIEQSKLVNKDYFEKIKEEVATIIDGDYYREAFDLSQELSDLINGTKNFRTGYPELYLQYRNLIAQLSWVGLPILSEKEVLDLFRNNFADIFSIPNYDILSKMKAVLLSIILLDLRDIFKKKVIEALLANNQKISKDNIMINGVPHEPTIANWFKDYNMSVDDSNKLAKAQYFVNGDNIKNLSSEEKARIKLVFTLYEKLKMSSLTWNGLENDIPIDDKGKEGYIRNGVFEPLTEETERQKLVWSIAEKIVAERDGIKLKKPENSELTNLRQLASQFKEGSLERKAVEEEIAKLVSSRK